MIYDHDDDKDYFENVQQDTGLITIAVIVFVVVVGLGGLLQWLLE